MRISPKLYSFSQILTNIGYMDIDNDPYDILKNIHVKVSFQSGMTVLDCVTIPYQDRSIEAQILLGKPKARIEADYFPNRPVHHQDGSLRLQHAISTLVFNR